MIPGEQYAYSLPGRCDGRLILNGEKWRSELPPSHEVPDLYGWVDLNPGGHYAGWFGPQGALGIEPDTGQPVATCSN
jgi:hypothetical protein